MIPQIQTHLPSGIMFRRWHAPSPEAVVLLVHGLGGHSLRWKFTADFFLGHNISSYALELKGFGETPDLKGHIDSLKIYAQDIRSLYLLIREEHEGKDVFIMAESMGGLIAFSLAAMEPGFFRGLICISPAFLGTLDFKFPEYVNIIFSYFFRPSKQFNVPFTPQMCTRDEDYQKVMAQDPREHRFVTPRLLMGIAIEQVRAWFIKDRMRIPVLFLLPGKDVMVSADISRKMFRALKAEDKELIEYPEMHHALSIEKDRGKVFEDILGWIKKRTGQHGKQAQ